MGMNIGTIAATVMGVGAFAYGFWSHGDLKVDGKTIPRFVNEAIPAKTGTDYGAKISFSIDRNFFPKGAKQTWAAGFYPGWIRSEWLFYGLEQTPNDNIAIELGHRARSNHAPFSLENVVTSLPHYEGKNVRFGSNEAILDTVIGKFETIDYQVDIEGKKNCVTFKSDTINAAVVLSGYFCGGGSRKPDYNKLVSILDTLKAPRFGIGISDGAISEPKPVTFKSSRLRSSL